MDIVEQYGKLNDTITRLEHQATGLRQDLLRAGAHWHHSRSEVVVRHQTERGFKAELLPPEILNDPRFWDIALRAEVEVRVIEGGPAILRPEAQVQVDLLRYRC